MGMSLELFIELWDTEKPATCESLSEFLGIPNDIVASGRPVSGMATTSASLSLTSFRAGLSFFLLSFRQGSRRGPRVLRFFHVGVIEFRLCSTHLSAASLMLALHAANFTQTQPC